jgi:mono/diheme cytochrome c family protein
MSLTPGLKKVVLSTALMGVFAISGCGDFESSFVYSDRTNSLIPQAQNGMGEAPGVKQILDDKFGNPQDLKAWMKLPIDFGGVQCQIEAFAADEGSTTQGKTTSSSSGEVSAVQVKLTAAEGVTLPKSASELVFVSGPCAGSSIEISSWNAETGEAALSGTLPATPATGDLCALDGGSVLQAGRGLYMRHCSHCHGTSGDGNGPTAQYLNPRPRDYRHGVFKFTSTNDMSRASRKDLERILKYGIPGTYMPSFLLMEDSELHALVEYVRFLALRGEYERKVATELSVDYSQKSFDDQVTSGTSAQELLNDLETFLKEDLKETAETLGDDLAETWTTADSEEAVIVPSVPRIPDTPESRRRGRELYLSKTLNCADCHGVDGAGNGPQTIAFEKNPITNEFYNEPGLHDIWDNLNQPRNLKTGIYRGGRRPVDLFARIHAGIKGSRMPSFKNTPHEDIWHIVNYILSVPFESEPGATGVAVTETATPAAGE